MLFVGDSIGLDIQQNYVWYSSLYIEDLALMLMFY